jgi:hypothetical protein
MTAFERKWAWKDLHNSYLGWPHGMALSRIRIEISCTRAKVVRAYEAVCVELNAIEGPAIGTPTWHREAELNSALCYLDVMDRIVGNEQCSWLADETDPPPGRDEDHRRLWRLDVEHLHQAVTQQRQCWSVYGILR